jgi:tRNA-2-methylthio-N6-dimethylallyladenosine synthase
MGFWGFGFSGETDAQFEETLSLYREVDFDISYNAQYSIRSGTLGVKLYPDDVSKEEKRERWDRIQEVMEEISLRKNQAFVGKVVSVLIDKVDQGFASGNTFEMKLARFPSKDERLVGKIVEMEVREAKAWVLEGVGNGLIP